MGVIPTKSMNWWGSWLVLGFELVGAVAIWVKIGGLSSHYTAYGNLVFLEEFEVGDSLIVFEIACKQCEVMKDGG